MKASQDTDTLVKVIEYDGYVFPDFMDRNFNDALKRSDFPSCCSSGQP